MPLLTIAMADVPTADAGLGSGIINVSQQVAGALGLAVLGTHRRPTTRRRSLAARPRRSTSSLIGGYHLAFIVGAASIAVGIVIALVLLRPRVASPSGDGDNDSVLVNLDMEQQAA